MSDFMKLVESLPADQADVLMQEEWDSIRRQQEGFNEPYDSDKWASEEREETANIDVLDDWSQTGRGSHVDFENDEVVPLEQGQFLGRGAAGDVHEVNIGNWTLAHKRVVTKRKLGGKEKKEIEILKRLPKYDHIIKLIGTYTHRQFLGILLFPVAVCDLHTFFEDVEAWQNTAGVVEVEGLLLEIARETRLEMFETSQKSRLMALGYDFPDTHHRYNATLVYSKIGCLISAISYLHDHKIRHKDLKPSNILLSRDQIWLSDFGSATDFSLLSQSATDNERGSPRYFSPEVNAWKPNGRAADIFSLGCVLLEIVVLHDQGTLHYMQTHRSPHPSFHANLDRVDAWLKGTDPQPWSRRRAHLVQDIKSMLAHDPSMRPTAKQLLLETTGYDVFQTMNSSYSIFGKCCRSRVITIRQHEKDQADSIARFMTELGTAREALEEEQWEKSRLAAEYERQIADHQREVKSLKSGLDEVKVKLKERESENSRLIREIEHRETAMKSMEYDIEEAGKVLRAGKEEIKRLTEDNHVLNARSLHDQYRTESLDKSLQNWREQDSSDLNHMVEILKQLQIDVELRRGNHDLQPEQPVKKAIQEPTARTQPKKSMKSRIAGKLTRHEPI